MTECFGNCSCERRLSPAGEVGGIDRRTSSKLPPLKVISGETSRTFTSCWTIFITSLAVRPPASVAMTSTGTTTAATSGSVDAAANGDVTADNDVSASGPAADAPPAPTSARGSNSKRHH